jgi:predicted aspartyl protease
VTTRRSLLTNLGLLALLGGGAWLARDRLLWPTPRPQFSGAGDGAWLPFTHPDQALVTIPVGIGGVVVDALIDSGAQYTSIDRGLVERLRIGEGLSIPMVALGVGGAAQVARGVSIDLDLGGLRIPNLRAAALDLSMLSQAMGRAVPLIVGFDVLSTLAVEIDFPRRRLRVAAPERFAARTGGRLAPVRRRGRALLAKVEVEGAPLEVLVDTGATGFLGLSQAAAEAAGLAGRDERLGHSVVLGGTATSRVVRVERFAFAGETARGIDIHIIELPNVPGFPKGLMGVEALRRHRVLIDAGGGRMRLYPD